MSNINRREFLTTAAAGTLAMTSTTNAEEAKRAINVGLIGCGWYGLVDLKAAFEAGGVNVIALCDVDSEHLSKTANEIAKLQPTKPKLFKDYQDLLKLDELEAVFIATPPHWHALPFIAACERKLPVYCEKPLAYDVREGQAMVAAAQEHKNIVQIGFQRRNSDAINQVIESIRSGQIGKVVQVDAHINYSPGMKDTTVTDPPASLDWDLWCGPAPKLPYRESIGHFHWRLEKAYGNGHLVDWGIHLIDWVRTILGESMPKSISASGGIYRLKDQITTPDVLTVNFEFDTCPVTWRHRIWGSTEFDNVARVNPSYSLGTTFYGEKGSIFANDDRWVLLPKGKKAEPQEHKPGTHSQLQKRHVGSFLDAVRENKPTTCTPADAFKSTATVQLAMIALANGCKINWDDEKNEIINNPDASRLLKRNYRPPWKHPYEG